MLGAVAFMVVGSQSFFDRPAPQAALVTVPSFIGMPSETAQAKVRSLDLVPEVQEVASNKEEGLVVEQNPQANDQAAKGSKVTLSVSGGRTPWMCLMSPASASMRRRRR